MKKLLIFILTLTFFQTVALADSMIDDFAGVDRAWDGQKAITNKEFEEAINTLQADKKKKEAKQKKKKIKKISGGGTSLHRGLDPTLDFQAQDILKEKKNEVRLLNVPVNFIIDNKTLEKGYYNVTGEKDKNGDIFLNFYQAHDLKGKIKANKTQNDYNSESIDFVKMAPYNSQYMKIMYGSLDFNAYSFVEYLND